jgi:L-threonylcarbamoyladenylate synthase
MKYRHYSPKAEVILFEAGATRPGREEVTKKSSVGVIRTKSWDAALGLGAAGSNVSETNGHANGTSDPSAAPSILTDAPSRLSNLLRSVIQHQIPHAQRHILDSGDTEVWDINLGAETEGVARGLFSALRELDKKSVEVIFVEGIDDTTGDDIAAAVMNRLRKAAEIRT